MKIRIKGNSVRLRLTKTEVEAFARDGRYVESTQFGHKKLVYALEAKMGIDQLDANFEQDAITIYFPMEEKDRWAGSGRVGYSNHVDGKNPSSLAILVEKDFTCLDNTIEDQSDNYPNPKLQ